MGMDGVYTIDEGKTALSLLGAVIYMI